MKLSVAEMRYLVDETHDGAYVLVHETHDWEHALVHETHGSRDAAAESMRLTGSRGALLSW